MLAHVRGDVSDKDLRLTFEQWSWHTAASCLRGGRAQWLFFCSTRGGRAQQHGSLAAQRNYSGPAYFMQLLEFDVCTCKTDGCFKFLMFYIMGLLLYI